MDRKHRELIHELERGLILTEPGNALEIRTNHPVHSISNPDDWLNENFLFQKVVSIWKKK